jgi:type IV pilus assembly protein PilC
MAKLNKNWLEKHARVSSKPHKAIKVDDQLTMLQQLATLLQAGTPLLDAVRLASSQSLSLQMRVVLNSIANQVASGTPLHKACAAHPNVFANHWVDIIQVGEATGEMALVMEQLSVQANKAQKTKAKLVSAMVYPCILIGTSVLCVSIMLLKVVPTFAGFFADFGAKLPPITQGVLDVSDFLRHKGHYLLFGIIAIVFFFKRWIKTEKGLRLVTQLLMAMPVLGEMLVQVAMEKFTSNMALLLHSGVPLLQALQTLRNIMRSNALYGNAVEYLERRVGGGAPLAASMEETELFPSMVTGMIHVGEDSGKLPMVLDQLAVYYGQKMELAITRVMSGIEPIIIIGMGVIVGTIMASIYLPMFSLSGAAH